MKKTYFAIGVLSLLLISWGLVVGIGITKARAEVNLDLQAQLNKAAELQARETLKMKEWLIYLTPKPGQRGVQPFTDYLTFTYDKVVSGQVTSKYLSSLGYLTSNFTLTIENDGTASWETMQTDEKEQDLAFLTGGLLRNGVMKGVLVLQPKKGAKVTYYYSTNPPEAPPVVESPKKKR